MILTPWVIPNLISYGLDVYNGSNSGQSVNTPQNRPSTLSQITTSINMGSIAVLGVVGYLLVSKFK